MNVAILSSSREEIDPYYCSVARSIANYLARSEFDLVFGGCSTSMMGICYEEFSKYDRTIYSFTTKKYEDDIANMPKAKHFIKETTFDMRKGMFELSDFIVALPGGIGTLAEILAFTEEKRSNDKDVPIVVYDENNDYELLFKQIEHMVEKGFASKITDYVTITHNKSEFEECIYNIVYKKGNKQYEK